MVLIFLAACSVSQDSALFKRAITALEAGRPEAAEGFFTDVLVKFPNSTLTEEVLFRRASLYSLYMDRNIAAIGDYRELTRRFPAGKRAHDAQVAIAEIYENKLGNCRKAILEYQKVISDFKTEVEDDKYQFRIASCYYKLLNFEQARIEFQKMIKDYPDSRLVPDAFFSIASAFQTQGHLPEAEVAWRSFLKEFPGSDRRIEARFHLASTLEEQERLAEALQIYEEIFEKYENKEVIGWRLEKVRERLNSRGR